MRSGTNRKIAARLVGGRLAARLRDAVVVAAPVEPHALVRLRAERRPRADAVPRRVVRAVAGRDLLARRVELRRIVLVDEQLVHQPAVGLGHVRVLDFALDDRLLGGQDRAPRCPDDAVEALPVVALGQVLRHAGLQVGDGHLRPPGARRIARVRGRARPRACGRRSGRRPCRTRSGCSCPRGPRCRPWRCWRGCRFPPPRPSGRSRPAARTGSPGGRSARRGNSSTHAIGVNALPACTPLACRSPDGCGRGRRRHGRRLPCPHLPPTPPARGPLWPLVEFSSGALPSWIAERAATYGGPGGGL